MITPLIPPPPNAILTSPLLSDDRAIAYLIDELLKNSGLYPSELARRLGVNPATINQYRYHRRPNPSIQWLVKLVTACGGRVVVEMPQKPLGPSRNDFLSTLKPSLLDEE